MLARRTLLLALAAPAAAAGAARAEEAPEPVGVGGGSLAPVLAKWHDLYGGGHGGQSVGYKAFGSANGIDLIRAGKIPFGGSEKPLQPYDLARSRLVQFPLVAMGFVPIVNIPGIASGGLVLDSEVLPDIFRGFITKWDDPRIKARNKDVALPALPIVPVNRREGSGTTYNVSNYFSKIDLGWMLHVGDGLLIDWPAGELAGGTAGTAAKVQQTPGAIGFVEYSYARHNSVAVADMVNRRRKRVSPGAESFAAAVENADFRDAEDFYLSLANQGGDATWPLTAAGYILMRREADRALNARLLEFFRWCLTEGGEAARAIDYVPMPHEVVELVAESWAEKLGWQEPPETVAAAH